MPITFECTCGRKFRTADENAGRNAVCPDCRNKLIVPASAVTTAPLAPPPIPVNDPPPLPSAPYNHLPDAIPVGHRTDAPPYGRPYRSPYDRDGDYRRRPPYGRDDITDRIVRRPPPVQRGGMTNAGIAGGILMMIGAVVWFVVGLQFDYVFFYPPILFVIGLIALIKALVSRR
ncbi:MAG TPA: hypothetical protein VMS17_09700 [Gemmataceae bacterium]|nr:hypothetical protein [Gemmataceae bacterium]